MNLKRLFATCISAIIVTIGVCGQGTKSGTTGILLVHYGTANDKSRELTIEKLNQRVAERFADCKVVEAYAAPSVINSLKKRGIRKLSIQEAIDSISGMGCEKLVVQTSMLLDGVMTDILKTEVRRAASRFSEVSVGRPLLYTVADCREMIKIIETELQNNPSGMEKPQVVLVGHGSDSPANAIYSQIDYLLKDEGKPSWHVATIEGYPTMDCAERRLNSIGNKNVLLVPLLYIAGNHLKEDIDGSMKAQLKVKGYNIGVVGKGLGEIDGIQNMIINKIAEMIGNTKQIENRFI